MEDLTNVIECNNTPKDLYKYWGFVKGLFNNVEEFFSTLNRGREEQVLVDVHARV
jgi:hypothetical protein